MSASSTWAAGSGSGSGGSGGRRKKVFEYLKAANELRQNYAAQWAAQRDSTRDYHEDYLNNTPGAFPDVEIARSGSEEMVIFPSYARRVVHDQRAATAAAAQARQRRDSTDTIDEYRGGSEDVETGPAAWEEAQDERTVVAVDVRGWVYSPHRGPMTRKHRLMIALARKLSGVPAPTSSGNDVEEESPGEKLSGRREDEIVDQEIQSIIKHGRMDAPGAASKDDADDGILSGQSSQRSATEPPQLSKDELSIANAHLMERLRPFLTNPVAGVPVSVFFFNDGQSQSRSIITDESGHFSLRAALPFIPTHIRALASEDLSAVKEVEIIEPTGVSLISDIDDTVKHSAIVNGAKEMFRNTFIRELSELTVDGVAEWYNRLAQMGVDVHYVSNAPWQLYPLLERYFKLVGLPPGSVHLKSYSGMLQGIFEPTSERKRGSLEQILRDFPNRKFILVGDSGEADLEVYTDIVMANPGRILGVFIRDITTIDRKHFFAKSVDHLESAPRSRSTPQLVDRSDMVTNRPVLPPRRPADPPAPEPKSLSTDDLIDLRDDEDIPPEPTKPLSTRTPPTKPSKPSALRSTSNISDQVEAETQSISSTHSLDPIKRKPIPPVPPRRLSPSKASTSTSTLDRDSESVTDARRPSTASSLPPRPKPFPDPNSGSNTTQERHSKAAPLPPPPRRTNTSSSTVTAPARSTPPPPPSSQHPQPPLQKHQSYPIAAATAALQYASEKIPWSASPSILRSTASNPSLNRTGSNTLDSDPQSAAGLPTKREELWARRWERAQGVLADQGVVLGSWRTGKDMQDVSVWLVQEALKNGNGDGNAS